MPLQIGKSSLSLSPPTQISLAFRINFRKVFVLEMFCYLFRKFIERYVPEYSVQKDTGIVCSMYNKKIKRRRDKEYEKQTFFILKSGYVILKFTFILVFISFSSYYLNSSNANVLFISVLLIINLQQLLKNIGKRNSCAKCVH